MTKHSLNLTPAQKRERNANLGVFIASAVMLWGSFMNDTFYLQIIGAFFLVISSAVLLRKPDQKPGFIFKLTKLVQDNEKTFNTMTLVIGACLTWYAVDNRVPFAGLSGGLLLCAAAFKMFDKKAGFGKKKPA